MICRHPFQPELAVIKIPRDHHELFCYPKNRARSVISVYHLNHNMSKIKNLYFKTEDIIMQTQNGDFNFTNSSYPYTLLSDADISRVVFRQQYLGENTMGPNMLPSKPYQKS